MKFYRRLLGNTRPNLLAAITGSALTVSACPVFAQHTLHPANATATPPLMQTTSVGIKQNTQLVTSNQTSSGAAANRSILLPPGPDGETGSASNGTMQVVAQNQSGMVHAASSADARLYGQASQNTQQVQYSTSPKEPGLLQRFGRAIKPQRLLDPPIDPGMDYPKQPRIPPANLSGIPQSPSNGGASQVFPPQVPPSVQPGMARTQAQPGSLDSVLPPSPGGMNTLPPVDQLPQAYVSTQPPSISPNAAANRGSNNASGMRILPPAPEDSGPPKVPPAILPQHPMAQPEPIVRAEPGRNPFVLPQQPAAMQSEVAVQTPVVKSREILILEEPGREAPEGVARATSPRKIADVASNDPFANLFPDDVPSGAEPEVSQRTAEVPVLQQPYTGMKLDSSFVMEPLKTAQAAPKEQTHTFPSESNAQESVGVATTKSRLKLEAVLPEDVHGLDESSGITTESSNAETLKSDSLEMDLDKATSGASRTPAALPESVKGSFGTASQTPEFEFGLPKEAPELSIANPERKPAELQLDIKVPDPVELPVQSQNVEKHLFEMKLSEPAKIHSDALKPVAAGEKPASVEEKFQIIAARASQTGLKGFCPVQLRDERELIDTQSEFEMTYQGKSFNFSSQAALDKFIADPERYSPAASCNDVIHLALTGEKLEGLLDNAVWYKGRLYLFSSIETMETFVASPSAHAAELAK